VQKTKFKSAVLFGSWAKHIAREDSDIDIAVIAEKKEIKQEILMEKITERLEKKYQKKIQLHFFEDKELKEAKSSLIKEIKKEAIEIF
jgi:predicted nucleotidyltransferase